MMAIEWGLAERPIPGEQASGDGGLVRTLPDAVLVGAVDGLGHGPEAAAAARVAIAALEADAADDLGLTVRRAHEALRKTRGVAMTLAIVDLVGRRLVWTGIGNVEGILFRARQDAQPAHVYVPSRGGILGELLPSLHIDAVPLAHEDTMVLATDGIRTAFSVGLDLSGPPAAIAERILAQHAKETDDALVLVARFLEEA